MQFFTKILILLGILPSQPKVPKPTKFWFQWLAYPWDNPHFFSVDALDQESADALAKEVYAEICKQNVTIMATFWRASKYKPN